jgi:hypothetical protein
VEDHVQALTEKGHTQRQGLLEEIKMDSKILELELRRFIDLCEWFKIGTFYRSDQRQDVVAVRNPSVT